MNDLRVVIAGGGTGGHVYPALAVADVLREAGVEAVFVGTDRGLETRLVPAAGFRLETIAAAPLPRGRGGLAHLPAVVARNIAGVAEARRLLGDLRPAAVLGVGGYVSAPAALAARTLGIPLVLHEQNVLPGRANRLLARIADRVALSWEASRRWIDGPRVAVTGNPVRRDIRAADRAEARRRRGLDGRLLVLVLGGSRGARRLNAAVPDLGRRLAAEGRDVSILWATGRDLYDEARAAARGVSHVEAVAYIDAMAEALAAADVVVARAGATTLAEVAVRGLASILVPYPHAAEAHQRHNAEAFAAAGAARIVDDADCDGPALHRALAPYLDDEAARRGAGSAAWSLARPRAAEDVAGLVLETAQGRAAAPWSRSSTDDLSPSREIDASCQRVVPPVRGWSLEGPVGA